ncbi:MAG: hypothetical protein KDD62_15770, partial [Bdellovibrionales bacterium]|nr:hypothetical protein [Bdellovibrionales bacterium]
RLLAKHYPETALSERGQELLAQHAAAPSTATSDALANLSPDLFSNYFEVLHGKTSWSFDTLMQVIDRTAIFELTAGCHYGCDMCYIDAPSGQSHIPWPHLEQIVHHVSNRQKDIIREELVDALVSDVLSPNYQEPENLLDVAICVARHRRNRFNNFSDHLMAYWRSNSTSWKDSVFEKDFSHVADLIQTQFRLVDTTLLWGELQADTESRERLRRGFKSERHFHDALTLSVAVSTVPFGTGSLGHQALVRMLDQGIVTSRHVRVSAPHPSLMPTYEGKEATYWNQYQNTVALGDPVVINFFATSPEQLRELARYTYEIEVDPRKQWWVDARLIEYTLRKAEENNFKGNHALEVVLPRLQSSLRAIKIVASPEGRGEKFAGNPFFSGKGSVMCVNGVVLSEGALHFQA